MLRSPVAISTAPAPKNNRLLKMRMVEHVEEARGQRESRRPIDAVGAKGERKPEPDENNADILHRVIGEQPLEIVLHQRVEHAEHGGDAGERQHDQAPPPDRRAQQIEDDAHKAVDRDLGHHPAHQRGDVAGRGRVGERQPDMQRNKPRLRSGAENAPAAKPAPRRNPMAARRGWRRRHSRRPARQGARKPAAGTGCRRSPSRYKCKPRAYFPMTGDAPVPAPRRRAT